MQVKERPILYSGPMVRAILENRKNLTRRIMNFDRLRVVPRFDVEADFNFLNPKPIKVTAGRKYPCTMNQHGAVCAVLPNGNKLGLKPGEFDFVCPYTDGKTILFTEENGKKGWRIIPRGINRLWVREAWYQKGSWEYSYAIEQDETDKYWDGTKDIKYGIDVDGSLNNYRPRPSIHMPRWASRILLEVTEVRIERLQDITSDDCYSEGVWVEPPAGCDPQKPDGWDDWSDVKKEAYVAGQARATFMARLHHCDLYIDAFRKLWESINGPGAWDVNPWVWVVVFKVVENTSIQEKII